MTKITSAMLLAVVLFTRVVLGSEPTPPIRPGTPPTPYSTIATSPADGYPYDHIQESPDGKYVLVLFFNARNEALRKVYARPGLYLKTDPSKPLWTIDWYTFHAYVSSDGKHVACKGPSSSSPDDPAISFYEAGKLLRQYRINQLVSDPGSLRYSPGDHNLFTPHSPHYYWADSIVFKDDAKTLTVILEYKEKYVFDITTGAMIEGKEAVPFVPANAAQAALHGRDLPGLLKLGKEAQPEMLETGRHGRGEARNLAWSGLMFGGEDSFDSLLALSADPSTEVRMLACGAMATIASPRFAPRLIELLRDAKVNVRMAALTALLETHQDKPVVEEAIRVVRKGSWGEKYELYSAIGGFHPKALIPEVIASLPAGEPDPHNGEAEVTRQATYWLSEAAMQNFVLDTNARTIMPNLEAIRAWEKAKQDKDADAWFVPAVEHNLGLLRTKDSLTRYDAFGGLHQLTGQDFGNIPGGHGFQLKEGDEMADQWDAWWKANRNRRRGELLIASIRDPACLDHFTVMSYLDKNTDERDVPALIDLYLWGDPASQDTVRQNIRPCVEKALHRITNVYSYGCTIVGGEREEKAIAGWRRWQPSK